MLQTSVLFILRRPSVIFTVITLGAIFIMFRDAPALSLMPSRPMRSLLFQLDRHQKGRSKPVRRSDLQWQRPRIGIAAALRQLRRYYSSGDVQAREEGREADDFWRDLYERELVKWALPKGVNSASEYEQQLQVGQQCVALTGGGISFQRVVLNLKILRDMDPHVKVHIYHIQQDPFDDQQVQYLKKLQVEPIMLTGMFSEDHVLVNLKQETIKLYAAMACPCEDVIVIDSDVILFHNPLVYFSDPQYTQNSALFFKDRKLHPNNAGLVNFLVDTVVAQPMSSALATSAMFTQKSSFQQDSSLVVIKKTGYRWLGVVAAMGIASEPVRAAWKHFRGDKETWWMGWETAGLPYAFEASDPASAGFLIEQDGKPAVCGGKLLHLLNQRAVWASGGVDTADGDGQQRLEHVMAVSDGTGLWTMGLCQMGPVEGGMESGWGGVADGWARIQRLYKPDPLSA